MGREFRTKATGHAKKSRHERLASVGNDRVLTVTGVSSVSVCVAGESRGDGSKTGKLFWDYILKGLIYHAKELILSCRQQGVNKF